MPGWGSPDRAGTVSSYPREKRVTVFRRALRPLTTVAVAATLAVTASACGGTADEAGPEESTSSSSTTTSGATSGSASAEPGVEPVMIDVVVDGDSVSPNASRVEAAVGQPIVFRVTTDVAAEIHGHTDPEFTIDAEPGTSEHTVTIDRAGSYDVELHDPERLLVRVDVRP